MNAAAPTRAPQPSVVSALAQRIAANRGLDLESVIGTGAGGRILKADVVERHHRTASPAPLPETTTAPISVAGIPDIPHESTILSKMRRTIGQRLSEATRTIPHIYLTVDVRLDALLALRDDLNAGSTLSEVRLTVNDLMIKALALALIEVPQCHVTVTADQLISFHRADIAVGVATGEGLTTPIIVGADTASLSAISRRMKDLAARARDQKLKSEDYTGGTATLSNLGMYGIKEFGAIINPPHAVIMALGASDLRPWMMDDGQPGAAQVMNATGSFDHRAVDGADAARLMQAFKALVEKPYALV